MLTPEESWLETLRLKKQAEKMIKRALKKLEQHRKARQARFQSNLKNINH